MKNKHHIKPKGFEDFRIAEVYEPKQPWVRFYDIEREIIWINTAAEEANNVIKISPTKW